MSSFEPKPDDSLAVEGNGLPGEAIVGVEFAADEDGAGRLEEQYENIDAPVEVLGSVVVSGLPPIDEQHVKDVADATGL